MQIQLEGLRIRDGELEGVIANRSAGPVSEVRLALFESDGARTSRRRRALELWDLHLALPARSRRFFRCRPDASHGALPDDDEPDARILSVVDG